MGNICSIFSNDNLYKNKNLNISTPKFLANEILTEKNYIDLSNSHYIPILTTMSNNYYDNSFCNYSPSNCLLSSYCLSNNSFSYYSSSNFSLPDSYESPKPNNLCHYNNDYDNNNDIMNNI